MVLFPELLRYAPFPEGMHSFDSKFAQALLTIQDLTQTELDLGQPIDKATVKTIFDVFDIVSTGRPQVKQVSFSMVLRDKKAQDKLVSAPPTEQLVARHAYTQAVILGRKIDLGPSVTGIPMGCLSAETMDTIKRATPGDTVQMLALSSEEQPIVVEYEWWIRKIV